MSIKYNQFCPIAKAAEVLGERWTLLIIRELLLGTTRFNDFQRALSQMSPSLLTKRLNQLIDCELVVRKFVPEQRRHEYHPTAAGKELLPVLTELGKWGMRWARGRMSDDELDVELLMYDLNRLLDESALPGGRSVICFEFPELESFRFWWIVINDGKKELCVERPCNQTDLTIVSDLRALTEFWTGDARLTELKRTKRVVVKGSRVLERTLPTWLRSGLFSDIRPARSA